VATTHVDQDASLRRLSDSQCGLACGWQQSPIQLHLLASSCGVTGSGWCRRCGIGEEENIAHETLECKGIRDTAATARTAVRMAPRVLRMCPNQSAAPRSRAVISARLCQVRDSGAMTRAPST
jgi:hypothetical protein